MGTDEFEQMTAARLMPVVVQGKPSMRWITPAGQREEGGDCLIYAYPLGGRQVAASLSTLQPYQLVKKNASYAVGCRRCGATLAHARMCPPRMLAQPADDGLDDG